MADSSLDDFFAKKDKSKKKNKSKLKPDDILAQQETQDAPKRVKKKKAKENKKSEAEESAKQLNEDDDEWKDYTEEEKVDYTGLRIREMQLAKAAQEEKEEEERKEEEEEGKDSAEGGPWNKFGHESGENTVSHHVHESKPKPDKVEPQATSKTAVGKYVPPSRRGEGGAAVVVQSGPPSRRKKKEAPNLHSDFDFPQLGGVDYAQGGEFEEVKTGGRYAEDPSKQRMKLQLDNKFGALENDTS